MKKLHKIYQLFLEYSYINACLVFEDQNFQGILLKKDLERKLSDTDDCILDHIIKIPLENLEDILFNEPPSIRMKIPYINSNGEILGALLYDEFVSEFFPMDFATRLSLQELFNYYENPILILNQFKTILSMNSAGRELLSEKVLGIKIGDALLAFQIGHEGEQMTITRQEEKWSLIIFKSETPHASYHVYQFIPYLR